MLKLPTTFIILFILSVFSTATAGVDPNLPDLFYEKLLAIKDGTGCRVDIRQDGAYLMFPGVRKKNPSDQNRVILPESEEKMFDITSRPAHYRGVQNEGAFDIEMLKDPTSDQWSIVFKAIPGIFNSIEGNEFYYLDGFLKMQFIVNPYNIGNYYRIEKLEDQKFNIQFNSKPQDANEADWKTIFSAEGVGSSFVTDSLSNLLHFKWRSEHHGNQVVVLLKNGQPEFDSRIWDVQYSGRHADTKLISSRDAPGRPLKYALWEGAHKTGEYDTNIEGFDQFPDVDMFYVQNTLDEFLPEDHPFRLAGHDIPVSRYTMGDIRHKPTLAYIKGGPVITKFGEFDPTYHALAQYFNVYVIEYRGSDPRMGEAGRSEKYLRGDIGGGPIRDVVSVLRAMQRKSHAHFQDVDPNNIVLAGHSYGGFALAKIMQDYRTDVEPIKGFLFLAPTLDTLSSGKFSGIPGGYLNILMQYLLPHDAEVERRTPLMYQSLRERLEQESLRVCPAHHVDKMPLDKRTLFIAGTYDGQVSVEESMKLYVNWVKIIAPDVYIPEILSQLDTYTHLDAATGNFTRGITTHEMLSAFNEWRQQSPQLSHLPVQLHLVEGAVHHFKDTPEILKAYIEKIRDFAASL